MNNYHKTSELHAILQQLPSFVNVSTDSTLYKILNIPSIEIETLSKSIETAASEVIPTSSSLTSPKHVYEVIDTKNKTIADYEKRTLTDFMYGPPTGYGDHTTDPGTLPEDVRCSIR